AARHQSRMVRLAHPLAPWPALVESLPRPDLKQQLQGFPDRKTVGLLLTSSSSPPCVSELRRSILLTPIRFLGSRRFIPSERKGTSSTRRSGLTGRGSGAGDQGLAQGGRAVADGAPRGGDQPTVTD